MKWAWVLGFGLAVAAWGETTNNLNRTPAPAVGYNLNGTNVFFFPPGTVVVLGGEGRTNWPTGGTTNIYIGGTNDLPAFPVFQLDMGVWTEFEIKASTNNFATLLYYFQTNHTNSLADDPQPLVYFTDSSATDPRVWRLSSNHVGLVSQLTNPTNALVSVVYFPSLSVVNGGVTNSSAAWCSVTNSNLVWSWTRLDALDYERDVSGRHVWRPIVPQWKPSRLTP